MTVLLPESTVLFKLPLKQLDSVNYSNARWLIKRKAKLYMSTFASKIKNLSQVFISTVFIPPFIYLFDVFRIDFRGRIGGKLPDTLKSSLISSTYLN